MTNLLASVAIGVVALFAWTISHSALAPGNTDMDNVVIIQTTVQPQPVITVTTPIGNGASTSISF